MKKTILFISLAILAISCQKVQLDDEKPESVQEDACLYANPENVKTTLNSDWTVSWAEKDDMTIFNAGAGETTYSDNCKFKINDPAVGKFVKDPTETGKSLVTGKSSYDWYACYPWMQYGAKPGATKGYTVAVAPRQIGYNSTTSVAGNDILVGTQKGVAAGTSPVLSMKHVGTLFKFTVTNNTGTPAAITGLVLDATESGSYIAGSFTMDWNNLKLDAGQMGSSKSYTCELKVMKNTGTEEKPVYEPVDETVADGASVDLYFVTAPFTIASGKSIKLTIKGSAGNLELTRTFNAATTFAAGAYNTARLSYAKPEYVVFTETFGANTVATANVPSYNKAGLTTAVETHKASYTYSVTGNASFAMSTTNNGGINNPNYAGTYLQGAAVKLPAGSSTAANSIIKIGGITVDSNTTYIFRYNKSKGIKNSAEYNTTTKFCVSEDGGTNWTDVKSTTDAGTISQEFTTGIDCTTIAIKVEATDRNPASPTKYPAVDYFQLIKK